MRGCGCVYLHINVALTYTHTHIIGTLQIYIYRYRSLSLYLSLSHTHTHTHYPPLYLSLNQAWQMTSCLRKLISSGFSFQRFLKTYSMSYSTQSSYFLKRVYHISKTPVTSPLWFVICCLSLLRHRALGLLGFLSSLTALLCRPVKLRMDLYAPYERCDKSTSFTRK